MLSLNSYDYSLRYHPSKNKTLDGYIKLKLKYKYFCIVESKMLLAEI